MEGCIFQYTWDLLFFVCFCVRLAALAIRCDVRVICTGTCCSWSTLSLAVSVSINMKLKSCSLNINVHRLWEICNKSVYFSIQHFIPTLLRCLQRRMFSYCSIYCLRVNLRQFIYQLNFHIDFGRNETNIHKHQFLYWVAWWRLSLLSQNQWWFLSPPRGSGSREHILAHWHMPQSFALTSKYIQVDRSIM